MAKIILEYIGDGRSYRGVPKRDLTQDDLDKLAIKGIAKSVIENTGLYAKPSPKSKAKPVQKKVEEPPPSKPFKGEMATLTETAPEEKSNE